MTEEELEAWLTGVSSLDAEQFRRLLTLMALVAGQVWLESKDPAWGRTMDGIKDAEISLAGRRGN